MSLTGYALSASTVRYGTGGCALNLVTPSTVHSIIVRELTETPWPGRYFGVPYLYVFLRWRLLKYFVKDSELLVKHCDVLFTLKSLLDGRCCLCKTRRYS